MYPLLTTIACANRLLANDTTFYRIDVTLPVGGFDGPFNDQADSFLRALAQTGGARRDKEGGLPLLGAVTAFSLEYVIPAWAVRVAFRKQTFESKENLQADLTLMYGQPEAFELAWKTESGLISPYLASPKSNKYVAHLTAVAALQTPAPSSTPTIVPSHSPSFRLTPGPTAAPAETPQKTPTRHPTKVRVTSYPSALPTIQPTVDSAGNGGWMIVSTVDTVRYESAKEDKSSYKEDTSSRLAVGLTASAIILILTLAMGQKCRKQCREQTKRRSANGARGCSRGGRVHKSEERRVKKYEAELGSVGLSAMQNSKAQKAKRQQPRRNPKPANVRGMVSTSRANIDRTDRVTAGYAVGKGGVVFKISKGSGRSDSSGSSSSGSSSSGSSSSGSNSRSGSGGGGGGSSDRGRGGKTGGDEKAVPFAIVQSQLCARGA
jgi:hypothetical protein